MARISDQRGIDMVGRRFGRLTVVAFAPRETGPRYWHCICDCTRNKTVKGAHLRRGLTQSCGYKKDQTSKARRTHGMSGTPEYSIWTNMKDRCLNKAGRSYKDWGGRGITICDEWRDSFEAFYADMGPRPGPEYELDRENNEGPYCKTNCRWTTLDVQLNNKRNNVNLTIDGITCTVAQWSRETDVTEQTIHKRLKRGWNAADAVFTSSRAVRKWGKNPNNASAMI